MALGAAGCNFFSPARLDSRLSRSFAAYGDHPVLYAPTKDDVALVDGRSFSITEYTAIRSLLSKPTQETVFWVGVGSIALERHAQAEGKPLLPGGALRIARYAAGDLPAIAVSGDLRAYFGNDSVTADGARREIDRVTAHATVQRNALALAELH